MEATAVSMGKAMLDGALGYAKSKAAEEIALQLGVVRDVNFITNELQMMQSFLMTADEEQSKNKVLMTWVKQIGDLAYKVEDSLMDFGLHNEKKPFLGCIPRSPFDRRRIALEVKELRAEVEDVSNRNLRYRLIKDSSGSKPSSAEEQASIATAALFGITEARFAALEHEKSSEVDLLQLINGNSVDLRVMAVWGTSGELGKTSAIQEVYDDPKVLKRFGFRAWIRLMHPFNPKEFLRNLVWQFYENSLDGLGKEEEGTSIGANVLMKMESMEENELVHVFNAQVSCNSYLIVIDDISTIVEWHCIKKYFPNNKKQSRIIVSTQQVEIASLCTEKPYQVSELKQLSSDQTIFLFHKKNSEEQVIMDSASAKMFTINETKLVSVEKEKLKVMHAACSAKAISDSNSVTSEKKTRFDCSRTLPPVDELLYGQESEESTMIELVGPADNDRDCKASMDSASVGIFEPNEAKLVAREMEKQKAVDASCSVEPILDPSKVTTSENNKALPTSEIQEEYQQSKHADEDKVCNSTSGEKFNRSRTLALDDEVLIGRETEKSVVIRLVCQPDDYQGCKVVSIWGMGSLGKTTLARSVYQCQQLGGWKHAWATALRPFNPEVLLRNLAFQLQKSIQEDPAGATAKGAQKKNIAVMKLEELKKELARLLNTQRCVVVLDDISSTFEWDLVKESLLNAERVIVTTREKNIAIHCSREYQNMYSLEGLKDDAALDLFINKVFKDKTEKDLIPAMMEQAKVILKKCDGLPLAISTIGGFLATKPKTANEWRKMNNCISAELQINPELRTIKAILMRSYDGLPYHLKSAFLYLSIFPEDHTIRWGRLVRRWIAEGYSRDMHGLTADELGRRYFDELLDRSMILPAEGVNHYSGKISSCQLHDIIREICISKAREENLVFTLEEGCCLSGTQGPIRHLVIGSNWKRDKDVLVNMLDLSHIRSLTVFGDWNPFFISDKMRFLRVLDLNDTVGLRDHHLDQIGQLLHLKYLSIRDCVNIHRLPNCLGNLRHLQTLDVRGTRIPKFPTTITKLWKLQHLHASWNESSSVKGEDAINQKYLSCLGYGPCGLFLSTVPLFLRPQSLDVGLNRHDIFNLYRSELADQSSSGIQIPRGVGKLKALQTLGHVNIARGKGKVALKDLKALTQLRKLGVVGVTMKNSMVFWSAIASLNQLRSLSVEAVNYSNELDGCFGEGLWPPSCLESLKMKGKLVRMTTWIHQLHNLSKLSLVTSRLEQDDDIQALGLLPNLAVLRLKFCSFVGKQLHLQNSSFPSLVVLELNSLFGLECVLFEKDVLPKLELLQVVDCYKLRRISGLQVLTSLREIRLNRSGAKPETFSELKETVQKQVAEHPMDVRLIITTC